MSNQSQNQSRKALKEEKHASKKTRAKAVSQESHAATEKQSRTQQKVKQQEEKRENKRPRRRVFPIWLRIIIVLILAAIAIVAGLMIGYGVLGDGNPTEALQKETWQHIIDIVTKD